MAVLSAIGIRETTCQLFTDWSAVPGKSDRRSMTYVPMMATEKLWPPEGCPDGQNQMIYCGGLIIPGVVGLGLRLRAIGIIYYRDRTQPSK